MAAIKPHLAEEDETTPEESAYWSCSGGVDGLGRTDPDLCPTPQEVLEHSHAGLLAVAWIRQPLTDQIMQGLVIDVVRKGSKYSLRGRFEGPDKKKTVEGAAWNPYSATDMGILSWTTKMGAPSFSLPAGASAMGGSCPGAAAGQSITPPAARRAQAKQLLPILYGPKHAGRSVDLSHAICEFCYAEGGQYATSSVQYAQLLRFAWARGALKKRTQSGRSVFVDVMIQAIGEADYKLGDEPKQWTRDGRVMRFFRLHDSGDFFSTEYFDAWKEITDWFHPDHGGPDGKGHPDPIWFWVPTRMWVSQKWVDHINKANTPMAGHEQNFAVRPSAYHVNEHGPLGAKGRGLGPGWAASSVVYGSEEKMVAEGETFDWDCRAYAVEEGPTCRGAVSNPKGAGAGAPGCRNCWMLQEQRVNYTWH
jgi:hypothetical protein